VDRAPSPDTAPASSYGVPCDFDLMPLARCADGETYCIPRPDQQAGFCSHPCSGTASSCPEPPAGQRALCNYTVNGQPFCLFVCKYQGVPYPCPTGFDCEAVTSSQSHCYPRP
jgi:hypothetical protein